MEPNVISIYIIGISLFATIVLTIQWFAARKKYHKDKLLLQDYGILLFAMGWFFWALMNLVMIILENRNDLILIILSTLNNFSFLLAYRYLEYSPSQLKLTPFPVKVNVDEKWVAFSSVLCFIVVVLITVFNNIADRENTEESYKFIISAIPDIFLTIFVFSLLGRGLCKTYWIREDFLSLNLIRISITGIIIYQFFYLGTFFVDQDSYLVKNEYLTKVGYESFLTHFAFINRVLFLFGLYPLSDSWINQKRLLPKPEKMRINFIGKDGANWIITVTIDSIVKHAKVSLTLANFKYLLELCIDKKKNGEESWKPMPEHKMKGLRRAIESITEVLMGKELNLSEDELKEKLKSEDPQKTRYKKRFKEALESSLVTTQPGKKENRRIRIPNDNILIQREVSSDLNQEKLDLKGIDKKDLTRIIKDLDMILGVDSGDFTDSE